MICSTKTYTIAYVKIQKNEDILSTMSNLQPSSLDLNISRSNDKFTCDLAHSVESPSTVDPQWDIWYWGSKWNLHKVCWSVVCCEWGTTSVYFGITYVYFIPSRLPVFAVEPQYLLQVFYFCQKYHLKDTYKIFKKFHVGLKFEWGL